MDNKECVIVIPIHTPKPGRYELISFEQCYRVMGHHDIYIVAPENLDLSEYKKIIPRLSVKRINPEWMSSLLNYNKLKLSTFFYKLFSGYKYLLTYELDAFVFKDNLDYWCEKNYDYIGAPWFEGWDDPEHQRDGNSLVAVGNSGFSLRNIKAITKAIKSIYYIDPSQTYKQSTNRYVRFTKRLFQSFMLNFSTENPTLQNAQLLNEDWIISQLINKNVKHFKVSPIADAVKFSFELRPETLFEMNDQKMPTGCHAWWRYNIDFWKPYIEKFGYNLS